LARDFLALGPPRSAPSQHPPGPGLYENHWPLFLSLDELSRPAIRCGRRIAGASGANPLAVDLDDEELLQLPAESRLAGPINAACGADREAFTAT